MSTHPNKATTTLPRFSQCVNSLLQDLTQYNLRVLAKTPASSLQTIIPQKLSDPVAESLASFSSGPIDPNNGLHLRILQQCIKLPQNLRPEEMIRAAACFFSRNQYFVKIRRESAEDLVNKICGCMQFLELPKGTKVVEIGERSKGYYIVVKGSLMVLYPRVAEYAQNTKKDAGQKANDPIRKISRIKLKQSSQQQQQQKKQTDQGVMLPKIEAIAMKTQNQFFYGGLPYQDLKDFQKYFDSAGNPIYQVENILGPGKSFGELGVIYNRKRQSTIVTLKNTVLMFVPASVCNYLSSKMSKSDDEIKIKTEFLKQHFYKRIEDLPMWEAQKYMYMFSLLELPVNTSVIKMHSEISGLYLLLEGTLENLHTQKQ